MIQIILILLNVSRIRILLWRFILPSLQQDTRKIHSFKIRSRRLEKINWMKKSTWHSAIHKSRENRENLFIKDAYWQKETHIILTVSFKSEFFGMTRLVRVTWNFAQSTVLMLEQQALVSPKTCLIHKKWISSLRDDAPRSFNHQRLLNKYCSTYSSDHPLLNLIARTTPSTSSNNFNSRYIIDQKLRSHWHWEQINIRDLRRHFRHESEKLTTHFCFQKRKPSLPALSTE